MATSSKRDVRLGVEIETAGEENLKRLASEVRALAREGGAAAPEYARLAEQLDKVAAQARELNVFKETAADLARLNAEQQEAVTKAAALSEAFKESSATAADARAKKDALATTLGNLQRSLAEARLDQDNFKAAVAAGTVDEAAAVAGKQRHATAVATLRSEIAKVSVDLREATTASNAADREQSKLERSYRSAAEAAKTAQTAFSQQAEAVNTARAAAERLGVEVNDTAAAQAKLDAALRASVGALDAREAASREMAEADRLAGIEAKTLAEMQQRGAQALAAEQAAFRESAAAVRQFEESQRAAEKAVEALITDLDRQNAAVQKTLFQQTTKNQLAYEFDRAKAAADQAAASAAKLKGYFDQLAQERNIVEKAFGQTGVRSIQAIEQEMYGVTRALITLQAEFRAGRISQEDFARATGSAELKLKALKAEINTIPGNKTVFQSLADGANDMIMKFGALGASIAVVTQAVRPLIDAFVQFDQARRILTTVTGSSEEAAKQIEFLRVTAQRSGQQFSEVASSYAKFAASALQTGLATKDVQQVFESVSMAAGNLGLSSDQAKRALEALSQIASKGVVNMEELRQQLGDALPGVLPALAKELGLTQQELFKVVESGRLLAFEAIPAIGRSLQNLQPQTGVVNGLVAEWNRFLNVMKQTGVELVEGPIGTVAAGVLSSLAGAARDVAFVFASANEAAKLLGLSVVALIDAITPGGEKFKDLGNKVSDFALKSAEKIENLKQVYYGASEATTALGKAAEAVGGSFAKLALEQENSIKAAEAAASVSEKSVQARKAEYEAVERMVNLTGDEVRAKQASASASQAWADAATRQAAADAKVVESLQAAKAQTLEYAQAQGLGEDKIKAVIEALDKAILKKTADAEKSESAARLAREEAAARDVAATAIQNNSNRYAEFRAEVDKANESLITVSRLYAEGKTSAENLEKAKIALATAEGKLKDAINDIMSVIERKLGLDRAQYALEEAKVKQSLEKAKLDEAEYRRLGQTTAAAEAANRVREIELSLSRMAAQQKQTEASVTIALLDANRKALIDAKLWNDEKENEYRIRRLNAETAVVETQTVQQAADAKERENQRIRLGNDLRNEERNTRGGNSSAADKEAASIGRVNTALERNITLSKQAKAAGDPYGRSNAQVDALKQQGGPVDNSYIFTLKDRLERGDTFGEDELPAIENALRVAKENYSNLSSSPVASLTGLNDAQMWVNLLTRIRDAAKPKVSAGTGMAGRAGGASQTAPSTSRASSSTPYKTIVINVNGQSRSVNVASEADASTLEQILRDIGAAAGRGG